METYKGHTGILKTIYEEEKENLRESKLTYNINLYKNKELLENVPEFYFKPRGGIL